MGRAPTPSPAVERYEREVALAAARLRESEAEELVAEAALDELAWKHAYERAAKRAERYAGLLDSGRWTATELAQVVGMRRQTVLAVAARHRRGHR